ncbi:MAG: COG1361 S-layer family protein [Candidatus Woesearchaeota archaeon]
MKSKVLVLGLFIVMLSSLVSARLTILDTNPSPIITGDYADITVQFRGNAAFGSNYEEGVSFYIKETDFIKPISSPFVIQRLYENQIVSRTFRVFFSSDLPSGEVPIVLVEDRGSGVTIEHIATIIVQGSLQQSDLRIGTARSIPNRLISDTDDNVITLTLQNIGDRTAELLQVTLVSDGIEESYFNSLQQTMPRLEGGEQAELSFDFNIPRTNYSVIPAMVEIEFRERDPLNRQFERKTVSLPLDIRLSETPFFEIVSITPQQTFQAGTRGLEAEVTVRNINPRDGENVRMRLFPDPSSPFDFDRTTYLVSPELREGEESSFMLSFDILSSATVQDYVVLVEIESTVGQNRFVQRERLVIPVEKAQGSTLQQNAVFLGIGFIVIAAIIGFIYKKKDD